MIDEYQPVLEESFKSRLASYFPNVAVLITAVGVEYWWIVDTSSDGQVHPAVKIGYRFDHRDVRRLVVDQSFYVFTGLPAEPEKLLKIVNKEKEVCKDFI